MQYWYIVFFGYSLQNQPLKIHVHRPDMHLIVCSMCALCVINMAPIAQAASAQNAPISQTKISAMLGIINFSYLNHAHTAQDTHSFALGGHLYLHSPALAGFSLGIGGDFATWTGIYLHADPELTGPYPSHGIAALRQAYLQYSYGPLVIRGGRQWINTPYASMDYYTFNPRAFTGVSVVVNVMGHSDENPWMGNGPLEIKDSLASLSFFASRMYSYESRFSSAFTAANRYTNKRNNGFYTLGARYQVHSLGNHFSVQGWYYNFYGFANMFYGQADITRPLGKNLAAFGGFQVVSEGNSGAGQSYLAPLNTSSVDAHVYGGKIGLQFGHERDLVSLVADYSPVSYNSFRHGGMIHPYNDLSGTMYTTTMQTGISDYGPGYAYGITSKFGFMDNELHLNADLIRYLVHYGYGGSVYTYNGAYGFPKGTAVPNQRLWSVDIGFSYRLSHVLKGLYLADYTDISIAQNKVRYPQYHNPYFSNRFYFKYRF